MKGTRQGALKKVVKGIVNKYLDRNKDYISIVAGKEGIGKSNLAFCLGHLTGELAGTDYGIKNITFNPPDTRKTADDLDPKNPLHIDEGANVFNKYESMSAEVRQTIKKVTMMREYNLHIIICISNPNDIHKYFKEHRMDMDGISVFRVVSEGVAWWLGNSATSMLRELLLEGKFSWSDLDNAIKNRTKRVRFPFYERYYDDFAEKYHKKKTDSVAEVDVEEDSNISKAEIIREIFDINPDARNVDIAQLIKTNPNYISQIKSTTKASN